MLEAMGLAPTVIGRARLDGYALVLGRRASLLPDASACAYGVVMDLSKGDSAALYAGNELDRYRPEPVTVQMLDEQTEQSALIYTLNPAEAGGPIDPAYALKLALLVRRCKLPTDYAERIETDARRSARPS